MASLTARGARAGAGEVAEGAAGDEVEEEVDGEEAWRQGARAWGWLPAWGSAGREQARAMGRGGAGEAAWRRGTESGTGGEQQTRSSSAEQKNPEGSSQGERRAGERAWERESARADWLEEADQERGAKERKLEGASSLEENEQREAPGERRNREEEEGGGGLRKYGERKREEGG